MHGLRIISLGLNFKKQNKNNIEGSVHFVKCLKKKNVNVSLSSHLLEFLFLIMRFSVSIFPYRLGEQLHIELWSPCPA